MQELILLNCQVPRERVSDLRAQMAANRLGVERMGELCRKYGVEQVWRAGDALQDYAERRMRAGILTNLYNKPSAWLANAHKELDAAVAAAYG